MTAALPTQRTVAPVAPRRSLQAPSTVLMVRPHHFSVNEQTAADNVFQSSGGSRSAVEISLAAYAEATAVADALTERGVANAETVARQLTDGAGSQLRGAPLLALSAQKIYADYPELRDDQLNYFKLDCAEGQLALSQVPPEFEGRLVDAHLAMNGATALVADYLFQNTNFYDPYSGTATDNLATGLVEDLYGLTAISYEIDIVKSWIKKLSLEEYFKVVEEQ